MSLTQLDPDTARLATSVKEKPTLTADKLSRMLQVTTEDLANGRYRKLLYRFLADQIPIISSCIWTWSRLSSAPGQFVLENPDRQGESRAKERLDRLAERLFTNGTGNRVGVSTMLPELFTSLYRDGIIGGFLTVLPDGSGVDRFLPIDALHLRGEQAEAGPRLVFDNGERTIPLDRTDFYYLALTNSISEPFGRSILHAVPFIAYIEQQLIQDLQRAQHNAGYSRLHVKITPPERMAGESDNGYTDRINRYFDATVSMIRDCEVDDNPVTWDNVTIDYIGPEQARGVTNSWFINHRALIEDICAGTNLAPFLLGYSYGATTTWSNFKFDIVMRQVRSVQAQMASLLEWIGNIELALAGSDSRCRFQFDNTFAYQAADSIGIESKRIDNLLRLYQAGLIDESAARERACRML
ncbi:MAG: hypothetical protein NDJ18_06730 [candidate division Zixibacteria bacterium]|nr:hypothetical protein [candidate division Zixibacteria bacterium]